MPPMLWPLVSIVFAILVAGVFVWAIDSLPGIDATFKQVARVLIIAVLVLYAIIVLYQLATGHVWAVR